MIKKLCEESPAFREKIKHLVVDWAYGEQAKKYQPVQGFNAEHHANKLRNKFIQGKS